MGTNQNEIPGREKLEIIRLVERSPLSAKQTLDRLGVPRTTFYRWYERYRLLKAHDLITSPAFIVIKAAEEFKEMNDVRGAPYHPQTQGEIERWHQMLKNRILLENYFLPGDLE